MTLTLSLSTSHLTADTSFKIKVLHQKNIKNYVDDVVSLAIHSATHQLRNTKFPVTSHYLWAYRKWSYHVETELPLLNIAWGGPSPLPSYALWCHCGTWVYNTQEGQLTCVCDCVCTYMCWLFEWLTNFWTSCTMLCVFMKKTSLSDFLFSVAAWLSSILATWYENLTTFINNGHSLVASERHELKGPQVAPADWETGRGQRWCCWRTEPFLSW